MKIALFAVNLLFFLVGLGIAVCAALLLTTFHEYVDFFDGSVVGVSAVLMGIGCIIFITGFFGCCGAICENRCLVRTFGGILITLILLEVAAGVTVFVMKEQTADAVEDGMQKTMQSYFENNSTTHLWDFVQEEFQCCGTHNYTDWFFETSFGDNNGIISLPDSCCKVNSANCGAASPLSDFWDQGCADGFIKFLKDNIWIFVGACIALIFVEFFGIILSCCLASALFVPEHEEFMKI